MRIRRLSSSRSLRPTAAQQEVVKAESTQFLLAEFTALRELRAFAFSAVEKRVQFIVAVQAAETAFVGVLLSQHMSGKIITVVAVTLGVPTLFLTYLVYRRALDVMIQARKYIRAMNAIRGFFVASDPNIAQAVLLPTNPSWPRFDRIGHGSTPVQSLASQMLILFAFLGSLLTAAVTWLILAVLQEVSPVHAGWMAALAAATAVALIVGVESRRMRKLLGEAEIGDSSHIRK